MLSRSPVPEQTPAPCSRRRPTKIALVDRVALVLLIGLVIFYLYSPSLSRDAGGDSTQHGPGSLKKHISEPIEGRNGHAVTPTRARICRVIRRLHARRQQTLPAGDTPAAPVPYPELFEYLGLDPDAGLGQAAVSKAWTARLLELDAADRPCRDEACRSNNAAAVRQLMMEGSDTGDSGGVVEEEGLIHAVASLLWEDGARAEYVNHVLPVLRPTASRIPLFGRSSGAGFEAVCPGD
ncbi:uncharacterized protein GLRG_11017 [Colletotrichum graminicola M1.001]|uniref:Uncharacterized protein n=1 Tax=Colletotrichum graminicola (strain M1.001 / M2 / FGSC 10212) TaxID=645133 RepID=E3QYH1_COLGM|nr:uncharacterized protein GLRG_11017 [Colletotrichum graminicola M1.001]EFQ35909.1 hypothetical protein GLRG_11017 [Colletotrichum graminicola M1.001]